ncbi:MAG: S8/S53 family peptidase [Pseudomonadota bacterium]
MESADRSAVALERGAAMDLWNKCYVKLDAALARLSAMPGNLEEIDWGDVRVAHLDTGYTQHQAFGPWRPDETSEFVLVEEGVNYLEPDQRPRDPLIGAGTLQHPGHGTRTLSVLCGCQVGEFSGCAPGLPVVPYRVVEDVFLEPSFSNSELWHDLAHAVRHAVDDSRCKVISISLGGFGPSSSFGAAIDHAYDRCVIVVAAAGQKSDRVTYPGKYARVIGVGGIRRRRESYSKYNEYRDTSERVDIWGPADPIIRANATLHGGQTRFPPLNDTEIGDGTSYATVHVAAAAAMWLVYRRGDLARYPEWRRIEAFRHAMKRTEQPLPGSQTTYRNGVLDADALLGADPPQPNALHKQTIEAKGEWG